MKADKDKLTELIATYLEGLFNPSDDGLYNELRAKRDTEALKAEIEKHYISRQELEEALKSEIPNFANGAGENEKFIRSMQDKQTREHIRANLLKKGEL